MVEASGLQPLYLATGRAFDTENGKPHSQSTGKGAGRNGKRWEEPLDLVTALKAHAAAGRVCAGRLPDALDHQSDDGGAGYGGGNSQACRRAARSGGAGGFVSNRSWPCASCRKIAWHGNFAIMRAFCIRAVSRGRGRSLFYGGGPAAQDEGISHAGTENSGNGHHGFSRIGARQP